MKCSQSHCAKQITDEPIVVMVGDVTKGNFWGNYCSYDCILMEIGGAFLHLKEGKSLASYVTPNSVNEFVENAKKILLPGQEPGFTAGNGNAILFNAPVSVANPAIPTGLDLNDHADLPDDDDYDEDDYDDTVDPIDPNPVATVVIPNPMQEDGIAWANITPGVTPTNVVDDNPLPGMIAKVDKYVMSLSDMVHEKLPAMGYNFTHKEQALLGAIYKVPEYTWLVPFDGYNLNAKLSLELKDDNMLLLIDFANKPVYGLTVNTDEAGVAELAGAVVKHMTVIVPQLKAAANANTTVGADTDPF